MLKCFKTEINPTPEQINYIERGIGTCRFVYNLFLAENIKSYKDGHEFISAYDFSKWLNNVYLVQNPDKHWIKNISAKSVKQSIINAETAYKKFFKKQARFPRFKKKGKSDVKLYFVKNSASQVIYCERHRIKLPKLGWVRLKEKGYIPVTKSGFIIRSGTVSKKAGRYYVSVLVEVADSPKITLNTSGLGIDIGVKELAVLSNGDVYNNINKTETVRKLEKQIKKQQRSLSRKYKNKKKGEATEGKNIQKDKLKLQRLYKRLNDIRDDYINQTINKIVKTKPSYIVIESLNISGMLRNRHLSKAVASQKLHSFLTKLINKCHQLGIEVRQVSRWFASSKICYKCNSIKTDLKLSDRVYNCICGWVCDRDLNASLNLEAATDYAVI